MLRIRTLTVLLCATAVLTSSPVSGTDDSRNETYVDSVKRFGDAEDVSSSSSSESERHKSSIGDARPAIVGEGGPIFRSTERTVSSRPDRKEAPKATMIAEGIKISSSDLIPAVPKIKEPKIRNPSIVARKGAIPPSKIAARKGVGLEALTMDKTTDGGIDEAVSHHVSRLDDTLNKTVESTTAHMTSRTNKSTIKPKTSTEHIEMVISAENKNASAASTVKDSSATSLRPTEATPTIGTKIHDATTSSPVSSTKRFKPKPTVTIGEMDIDKPIPASPTKTPPLGMPRKIDYIVPVIITIMALPLLGGVAFFLYKRGRDCWDKRHYRRMDFLIDGMYNDHTSWK